MPAPRALLVTEDEFGLATDLYQLTMAAAAVEGGLADVRASFELFARRLPERRSFLTAAGLEQALAYLERWRFPGAAIDALRRLPNFRGVRPAFFEYLRGFRFRGEVEAMPEGTLAFAGEPLLRVTASYPEAQMAETYLLSTVGFQTLVATKAARVVQAAQGRGVVDFGTRRAHGPPAGLWAARAAYIGGCAATSNVMAASELGIPAAGTLAHAFIMGFDDEAEAFRAFARAFPEPPVLLLDTYDTVSAARTAVGLGVPLAGVRLDSGDLAGLAREVRRILDDGGHRGAKIVASGDLNEDRVAELLAVDAPIDVFGVGTDLSTSRDAPALGVVYKLVEIERDGRAVPRMKRSADKATTPGRKQVFRSQDAGGRFAGDVIGRMDEALPGAPLLEPVVRGGRAVGSPPDLQAIQARARDQLRRLPDVHRRLHGAEPYPVELSAGLRRLMDDMNA